MVTITLRRVRGLVSVNYSNSVRLYFLTFADALKFINLERKENKDVWLS